MLSELDSVIFSYLWKIACVIDFVYLAVKLGDYFAFSYICRRDEAFAEYVISNYYLRIIHVLAIL